MIKPEIIRRRLERFSDYLDILKRFDQYDLEAFLSNPERYGSAERFLQLSIECTLDVGSHIIADGGLGGIEQSRDSVPFPGTRAYQRRHKETLGSDNWIPEYFGARLSTGRQKDRLRCCSQSAGGS